MPTIYPTFVFFILLFVFSGCATFKAPSQAFLRGKTIINDKPAAGVEVRLYRSLEKGFYHAKPDFTVFFR